ncbi:DUF2185 domain-containing protein [Shewanella maritima]|uniref:DUF2185 domain-containing protein n=1 Tax=Shewanella maritima TaxID=2520507 RepID=A0A411PL72_9GAMM|nr:DUF2185 domain-containing protein [Shewanella maritima]QBF84274.1 DUF2185 domain-containing protein [Shewanella maritima]
MEEESWQLENAQKIADEFPYTFYKPSPQVIDQLEPGNQAKLIFSFESDDPEAPQAERMWVEIAGRSEDGFSGYLDNDPAYIKDLKHRDPLKFKECHIIDTDLKDPVPSITEKYIKRCFVTNNVLYEGEPVGYLYREAPDDETDSGWRLSTGLESEEYMDDADNISYVSLGAVLRVDDSFVDILDSDIGVEFGLDESGKLVVIE